MIVVSNTSPITNLAAIQQLELLHLLYTQIYIPDGVWSELGANDQIWPGHNEVRDADWIIQRKVTNEPLVTALMLQLDRGEAETIALALELNSKLVIMDETYGRRIAERYNLPVIGVLGILLEAKHRKMINAVLPYVDMLRQSARFFVSNRVYQTVRTLAKE